MHTIYRTSRLFKLEMNVTNDKVKEQLRLEDFKEIVAFRSRINIPTKGILILSIVHCQPWMRIIHLVRYCHTRCLLQSGNKYTRKDVGYNFIIDLVGPYQFDGFILDVHRRVFVFSEWHERDPLNRSEGNCIVIDVEFWTNTFRIGRGDQGP